MIPTVLDLLNAPIPRQVDGFPLTKWLHGGTPKTWRSEAHMEFDFGDPVEAGAEKALGLKTDDCGLTVIRSEEFKYVHFTALPPLLYDLRDDPNQMVNRAGDPAYHSAMLEMAQRLITWRMQTEDREFSYHHVGEGVTEARNDRYDDL